MRSIFGTVLAVLIGLSVYIMLTQPEQQSARPILYWKTDPNPQRYDQIELFHQWLIDNGHVDASGGPVVELRVDTANTQSTLIQAVSGVGGDIMDAGVFAFQSMGVLTDLTEDAQAMGFGTETTYPSVRSLLTADGRQYGYPCNAGSVGLWSNADTFKQYDLEAPPEIWDPDTFERIGKAFVKRANAGRPRQEVFFCQSMASGWTGPRMIAAMHRSLGLDDFNETLTRCTLDDERYIQVLERLHKWTYEDHLFPSAAEEASMASEAGYGGSELSHLQHGKYGMILSGRWCLIRIREFPHQPQLSLSRFPQWEFQNMVSHARCATLYAGSDKKEYAKLFFAFLADSSYNRYIVEGADGLPPNPRVALADPGFANPKDHPNEGSVHARELEWTRTISIGQPFCPYYKETGGNWKQYGLDMLFNDKGTAEEAARETANRINAAIDLTVAKNPRLRERYEADVALQEKIDARKRDGRKIPRDWIRNPFHLKYYESKGLLE